MMTRWIIATSLRFRMLVLAIAVDVMALGVTRLRTAPVDARPEFTPPGGVSRHFFRRRFRRCPPARRKVPGSREV
jgi:hypothetical protein